MLYENGGTMHVKSWWDALSTIITAHLGITTLSRGPSCRLVRPRRRLPCRAGARALWVLVVSIYDV